MLTLGYLWEEYEKFWFFIMCQIFSIWLGFSGHSLLTLNDWSRGEHRIYSNKRRGAYLIFRATSAAVIRGRRVFKNCTRRSYFFYIFIQRYTFYLLIFLWTDTKLMVNLELQEKFTRWKKNPAFHDNESENISGESELLCRCGTI